MSGSQAAQDTARRDAPSALPSWESPGVSTMQGERPRMLGGIVTLSGVTTFLRRNGGKIGGIASTLFAIGVVILLLIPLRYAATALVVVDPREQRVTTEQDVLPGIGQDAAALQSLIEIAKSDGFLRPLIEKLKVAEDDEIAGGETNPSRLLEKFRTHLDISRRGLTYVIAMTFVSKDPQRAAYYANTIAEAFVSTQSRVRTDAADEAAGWLNSRLKTLSDKLRISEDAVAAFKAEHRIVSAGRESTTRQLRVTELSQQVSAARLRAEEAKNRYEQAQRDLRANIDGPSASRSDLLNILRAQRTQLNDQIAQKRAVLGDRHPDLVISYNQLAELNRQIETERKRNIDSAKSDFETMLDQQKSLEQQMKAVEGEMLRDGQAAVKLQELQREADANRNIYEQFLSRFNTTNEQRLLQATQTKVASFATPPTRSTRPSLVLILPALAIGSLLSSIASITILDSTRGRSRPAEPVRKPEPKPAAEKPVRDEQTPAPALPVWARIPDLSGPKSVWGGPTRRTADADLRQHLSGLLDTIAVKPGQRGKVVLVTSTDDGVGKSAVARSMNAAAIDRGLLSVLIEVAESGPAQARQPGEQSSVQTLKTTVRSLMRLLGSTGGPGVVAGDVRSEFGLIVIDSPSLARQPDMSTVAAQSDVTVLVVDDNLTDPKAVLAARSSLARFGNAPAGVVVNKIDGRTAANQPDLTRLAS